MKKVIIVGAGVAGLSAGVYARQSGFDVTICEAHSIPGGNCTSWRRKGYLFEGGLHWLTGSAQNQPLHKVWQNLGAINADTKVYIRDPFMVYEYNGQQVCLYRNAEKLREHLTAVSPEDKKEINALCDNIKRFSKVMMPVTDIRGVKVKEKSTMKLSSLLPMLPAFLKMPGYNNLSAGEYRRRFKSPAIRGFISNILSDEYAASSLFFVFGAFASGDGGYLEGGSLKMAMNMADRFTALGGKIQYSTRVQKVLVRDGKAVGVMANGEEIAADAVIVTADTLAAIDNLFDKPLCELWTDKMRALMPRLTANTFISLGVKTDLSALPESLIFNLKAPFEYAGQKYDAIGFQQYSAYEGYAPEGCTPMTVILIGDTYDYWKAQKDSGQYEAEKQKLADAVIGLLSERLPQIRDKIAVVDVATPLTYERYCGSCHGSWMTLTVKGEKMTAYPSVSESIANLYFAGQRIQPPGGLPVACDTGRKAAQYLCRDARVVFQGEMASQP